VNNRGQILAIGQDGKLYLATPSEEDAAAPTLPQSDASDAKPGDEAMASVFEDAPEPLLA
jgi:hypothetical protein